MAIFYDWRDRKGKGLKSLKAQIKELSSPIFIIIGVLFLVIIMLTFLIGCSTGLLKTPMPTTEPYYWLGMKDDTFYEHNKHNILQRTLETRLTFRNTQFFCCTSGYRWRDGRGVIIAWSLGHDNRHYIYELAIYEIPYSFTYQLDNSLNQLDNSSNDNLWQ